MSFPALTYEEAFTTGPGDTPPDWEPVDVGVRSFSMSQGRTSDLDRDAAGSANIVLDARDRTLDPTYNANVLPNNRVRLSVGLVAEVLEDEPVSYWRLNSVNDVSVFLDEQQVRNGTGVNTPAQLQPSVIDGDFATLFEAAASEYINTGDLSLFEAGDCTYEAWINTTTVSGAIVSEGNSASANGFSLIGLTGAGKVKCEASNNAGTGFSTFGTTTVTDGEWHHTVLVKSGTSLRLYVDGQLEGTPDTLSGAFTQNKSRIGNLGRNTESAFFTGTIAEVAVYDHALSAARILAHYEAGITGIGSFVFAGYADAHNIVYSNPDDAVCNVQATDVFKMVARAQLTGMPARPEEHSGTRVSAILSYLGLSLTQVIFTGQSILEAEDISEQSAIDAIQACVDSEAGRFSAHRDGVVHFISRNALNEKFFYIASQATFSDSGAAGVIPYTDIVVENSETLLRNSIQLDHPTLDSLTVSDSTSINAYGLMTYTRTVHDVAATAQNATAEYLLSLYKDPQTRFLSVTVPTSRPTATYPNGLYGPVLGLRLGVRVTVEHTPPGPGSPISQECYVISQSHQADASRRVWTSTFGLALAPPAASYGTWDNAVWDTSTWG